MTHILVRVGGVVVLNSYYKQLCDVNGCVFLGLEFISYIVL